MKKIFILFILTLVGTVILFGCTPNISGNGGGYITDNADDGDRITEDGTIVDGGESNGCNDNGDSNNNNDSNDGNNGNNNNDEGTNNDSEDDVSPEVGTKVGYLLANVTIERLNGGTVSPNDYKGKIVILNIWATWCPPCKAELPDFHKIASEYKDDVVIIAAHTPSGNANAKAYVDQNFPETDVIFAYDTPDSRAYLAAGGDIYVPQTAIIDENGVIIYADSGLMTYEQLVAIIEGQLGK